MNGDCLYNFVMGNMGHQLTGKMTIEDKENNITGWIEIGK